MRVPSAVACVFACAIALAGCNTTGKGTYGLISAPTSSAVTNSNGLSGVVVSMAPSGFFPISTIGSACSFVAVPVVGVSIFAATTVTVDAATLRLGDGSHVGGPSVTFPSASLASQFGSTVIVGGNTRRLVFNQPFGCTVQPLPFIFADVVLTDGFGNSRTFSVSSALH